MPDIDSLPSEHWQTIARMRWSRYPVESDFDTATAFARSYIFLDVGRLFTSLLTSIYMVSRESEFKEARHLLRLHAAAGLTTPFIWGAPRGQALMRKQMASDPVGWLGADLHAGAALKHRMAVADRTWFHAVHWELQSYERAGHVRKWLRAIRSAFPIRPRFLTGLDWQWIEKILPISRIAPFRDNPDGPYVLLLRDIEERQRDTTLLRTAIERLCGGQNSCRAFVLALIEEYGASATAFVRYFLTPDTIMLLGLAPNMTAALSERIAALELCATEFSFGELLSEDELQVEQQTLTSALMLLNVNANQFDVPWPSFKRDAADRGRDNYNAYVAYRESNMTLQVILDQQVPFSHKYKNGRVMDYIAKSSLLNLIMVILDIVDAFYDHPSYGIEAILSTRFRHDTLRREYKSSLATLRNSHIPGVAQVEQFRVVDELTESALSALDHWLMRRMQTLRPGFEEALFDFTLPPDGLAELVSAAQGLDTLDQVLDMLVERIIVKLDASLVGARTSFLGECLEGMTGAVNERSAELAVELGSDPVVMNKLTSAVNDTITRLSGMFVEWIRRPEDTAQRALTFAEIKVAVDGRFERAISDGGLSVDLKECQYAGMEVRPEKVKLYFDLLSEIVANGIKHSGPTTVNLHIKSYEDAEHWGYIYTTPTLEGAEWDLAIQGHRYQSLSDALFREGNSGLTKISAIAASIMGADVTVQARQSRNSFQLRVPLGCRGGV